jgi:hypothetical protein
MNNVSSALEVARRLGEIRAIHIRDETEGHVALAVVFQRLVGHHRPEVGAADADVDYISDAFAGMALPRAAADMIPQTSPSCRARREPRERHPRHRRRFARPLGARNATCRTARCSVTLILSPANMASMCWRRPDCSASSRAAARFRCDSVLRVVEVETQGLQREAFAALRILREELPKV